VGKSASVVAPSATGDSPILRDAAGKPVVTYIGAEYCPYCAAERWAIAVALSRFGTFSNLSATHSAANDVYPNTQTLSFYGSQYSSQYLDFQPVEEQTNQAVNGTYPTLQRPTAQQSNLLARFDQQGSIPFLDIANKYVVVGASYSPQVLAGLTQTQIAQQLGDPSSPVAQAIDGAANEITAAIVEVTGQQPTSVASSPVIASIAKSLGA
jgi:thiol-disulfide isomerase/thioredoxin